MFSSSGHICQSGLCRNGGTCSQDEEKKITCTSPAGVFGYFCEYTQGNLKYTGDL